MPNQNQFSTNPIFQNHLSSQCPRMVREMHHFHKLAASMNDCFLSRCWIILTTTLPLFWIAVIAGTHPLAHLPISYLTVLWVLISLLCLSRMTRL
jgi:hypothetical protein